MIFCCSYIGEKENIKSCHKVCEENNFKIIEEHDTGWFYFESDKSWAELTDLFKGISLIARKCE